MELQLRGKRALVTGSTAGIGFAIARALAVEGAQVVVNGRAKTAQLALSRGLAETVAGTGVTVNVVLPGPTRSEGVGGFVEGLARSKGVSAEQVEREFFRDVRPTSLLPRFESPGGIAPLFVFVAGRPASAI